MTTPTRPGPGTGSHAIPHSYDEIVRETVMLPDGSHRPMPAEEAEALSRRPPRRTPPPGLTPIRWALAQLDEVDVAAVEVALTGSRVTLTGVVANRDARARIVAAVEAVPGVEAVVDALRVVAS